MQREAMLHPAAIPAASRVNDGCVSMGRRTATSKERAVQEGVPRRAGPAYQTTPARIPASALRRETAGGRARRLVTRRAITNMGCTCISVGRGRGRAGQLGGGFNGGFRITDCMYMSDLYMGRREGRKGGREVTKGRHGLDHAITKAMDGQ